MKKMLTILTIILLSISFTGCMPKTVEAQKESKNIDDYKNDRLNNNGNADLIIYSNTTRLNPEKIKIDNNKIQNISGLSYAYFEVEPGIHWISIGGSTENGIEVDSYTCVNLEDKKYVYRIDSSWHGMGIKYDLYEKDISDIKKNSKQVVQNNKYITSFKNQKEFTNIKLDVSLDNEKMKSLKSFLDEKFSKIKIVNPNDKNILDIKISLVDSKEGNQFGRWFLGDLDTSKKYSSSLFVKVEFKTDDNIIDTFYTVRNLEWGIFGGSEQDMIKDLATEITSYTACRYFKQQILALDKDKEK
ncbi:hypothetical protein CRU92_05355 [Arcobacter sp. FW59]|nr:hypothetical protein CRU92_05355 [Arcobacter sp. FW59]